MKNDSEKYEPSDAFKSAWPHVSGNAINGLGETRKRRASPSFWHPPFLHPFGKIQQLASLPSRHSERGREVFKQASIHPKLVEIAADRVEKPAQEWEKSVETFAMENEADIVGITTMKDHYIVAGFDVPEQNVIVMGFQHDYENLSQAPASEENDTPIFEYGRQYARGTRASFKLANWIRSQGYEAQAYPGPRASNLLLIPAAIDAGLGELGKHGSMINRKFGSGFRLAAVTTDLPLDAIDCHADVFGADDFCQSCQLCTDECPPIAISDQKKMVRGVEKWYVDFDKCIPYFAETGGCGICIAVCPWTRPGIADNLLAKMAKKRSKSSD